MKYKQKFHLLNLLGIFFALGTLASCASQQGNAATVDIYQIAVPEFTSRVIVTRERRSSGSGINFKVFDGATYIGQLKNGESLYWNKGKGELDLRLETSKQTYRTSSNIKPGKIYHYTFTSSGYFGGFKDGGISRVAVLDASKIMPAYASSYTPNSQKILGSTATRKGFSTVIEEAKIGSLTIRRVRNIDNECELGYQDDIEIDGAISDDTVLFVDKMLDKVTHCGNSSNRLGVFLNSNGGHLTNGYELGQIFRKHNAIVIVTHGQICASACAVAFMGAKHRLMIGDTARLFFHAPYIETERKQIHCINKEVNVGLKEYLIESLGPDTGSLLYERSMQYCSKKDGWEINSDAASLLGLLSY